MRDKLIELIEKGKVCPYGGVCPECEYDKYDLCFAPRLADALIANGVTFAEDNNVPTKWIPVSESLPEWLGYYLCTVIKPVRGGGYIRSMELVYYDVSIKCWECEDMIITHWMPLPEPPKEDE